MYTIDADSYRSSIGFDRRIRFLIMHYTSINFEQSITALTGEQVSCHYLIPDPADPSYLALDFTQVTIFNLVDENERAWHAGVSAWGDRSNLNDSSIGIEIVNLATENENNFVFPAYHPQQIDALKELTIGILKRYPDIRPNQILGHSDIAIGRKNDPGAAFPWKALYEVGIGAWYDEEVKLAYQSQFDKSSLPPREVIFEKFKTYGYDISHVQTDLGFEQLLRAFQMHFRATDYSGKLDSETTAILYALVDKYC